MAETGLQARLLWCARRGSGRDPRAFAESAGPLRPWARRDRQFGSLSGCSALWVPVAATSRSICCWCRRVISGQLPQRPAAARQLRPAIGQRRGLIAVVCAARRWLGADLSGSTVDRAALHGSELYTPERGADGIFQDGCRMDAW